MEVREDIHYTIKEDIDVQESVVKCADCNTKLLKLVKIKDSENTIKMTVKCPCGGSSFLVKLEGKYGFFPVDGYSISNISDNIFTMEKNK